MRRILNSVFIFFFALFVDKLNSQTVSLIGNITDSLQIALPYANIIALPNNTNSQLTFAIADELGRFKLLLKSNETYQVTVSYIGYEKNQFEINLIKNESRNIVLKEESNLLDEVAISGKIPVRIKKDTIVFDATFFSTGTERKLKDLLEKLPGVEVEKDGVVSVAGKKVNKLLVEGKEFFGGQTKMGIENIPVNAVNEIEMLDNYTPVSFLKEIQNSDLLAMNIKLKKEKKQFYFGDLEAGITPDKQYLLNPKLFYYSPNKTYNLIADLNNIGIKSFTIADYLNIEGGINRMVDDPTSYFKLARNEMANFLENRDYKSGANKFGAFHHTQQLNTKTDINSYIIYSNTTTNTQTETLNLYLAESGTITENKNSEGLLNHSFLTGKIMTVYKPGNFEDISFTTFVKTSKLSNEQLQMLSVQNKNNQLHTENITDEINLKQHIDWHKRLSKKQTTSLSILYELSNEKPNAYWLTDYEISSDLIPIVQENEFNLYQHKTSKMNLLNADIKHYWVINNSNHIYTSAGYIRNSSLFKTEDYQVLENKSVNSFKTFGFDNNLDYTFSDFYLGINHKFKSGILTVNSGIFGHNYNWEANQQTNYKNDKLIWLPEVFAIVEFNKSEKLNLRYNLKSEIADAPKYGNQFQLLRYNSVFKGNEQLENELFHAARLWYTKFSMYRGIVINTAVGFQKKMTSLRNEIQRSGVNQFISPILTENPETAWSFNANIDKKFGKFTVKAKTNWHLLNYEQTINNMNYSNELLNRGLGIAIVTKFKEWPNVEIGLNHRTSKFAAQNQKTFTTITEPVFKFEYALFDGLIVKADYTCTSYTSNKLKEEFEIGNASLYYTFKNSPWGFKLSANNMFGVDFKHQNTFSDYIIATNKIYILPRTWMASITYKL